MDFHLDINFLKIDFNLSFDMETHEDLTSHTSSSLYSSLHDSRDLFDFLIFRIFHVRLAFILSFTIRKANRVSTHSNDDAFPASLPLRFVI